MNKSDGCVLIDSTLFRYMIRALQYCVITRPDISFIMNKLCQFFNASIDDEHSGS